MSALLQYLITGVSRGFLFALLATGFVVIFRVTKVVNFAQGAFVVLGGFIAYSLLAAGVPHGVSEGLAVLATAGIGLVFGAITILGNLTPVAALITTIGLAIASEAIAMLVWGTTPLSFSGLGGTDLHLGHVLVQPQYLLLIGVSLVVLVGLWLVLERTYVGKGLTACASNPYAARLAGINVKRMGLLAFGLGGALGGLGGVLIMPLFPLTYDGDVNLAILGFAAAIVGGLTSPGLALVGGLVFGIAEQLVAGYWSQANETAVALGLMIVLLLWNAYRQRAEQVA
ncbi:MAG: branched-chain amino acid ABC transporter permease [Actinomycetota bacterium]|jgi:branched-chain amino acid transport system permease protein|nr:branched-chain amino acid ABC transporter permease [Actinomycetota bacterium]MDA8075119.1 branched-chain amino acid ABC transporter permease [Actinomycetota bacterium]